MLRRLQMRGAARPGSYQNQWKGAAISRPKPRPNRSNTSPNANKTIPAETPTIPVTLACAGCEIAEYLTHKAGEEPFSTHVLATFPDLDIGKIRQLQNQYSNAFKHARTRGGIEREDSELLARFGDEVNDHTLFIGWRDYQQAVGTLPIEAQIFQPISVRSGRK